MTVEVIGTEDIERLLNEFAPNIATNLMRATVHGIAGEITKRAKARVPKRTGNLRRSLKTKRRRGKPGQPVSDVLAETGKNAKNDGFYWRFVEYGTQTGQPEQPFMRPARDSVKAEMSQILKAQFKDKLIKAVEREKRKRAKR